MNFYMTANVKYSLPLNKGAFYETDADSLYLLFKPIILAQTRKAYMQIH